MPWKSIGTSVPFWALCISHMLNNFGWYMLLVELPLFMSNGLGFNIKQVKLEYLKVQFRKKVHLAYIWLTLGVLLRVLLASTVTAV